MRFLGTRRARLVILAGALVALALTAWAGHVWVTRLQAELVPALLARARTELGRAIEVAALDYETPGLVVGRDLRIGFTPALEDGVYASATTVELHYSPALLAWSSLLTRGRGVDARAWVRVTGLEVRHPERRREPPVLAASVVETSLDLGPLFRGGDVAPTIPLVRVTGGRVRLARHPDGTWNYSTLLPRPPKPRPITFRGEVRADDLKVELTDDYRPKGREPGVPLPARHTAEGRVRLSLADAPRVAYSGVLTVAGENGGTLVAAGHASEEDLFLSLEAKTSAGAYWYRYFVPPTGEFELLAASGSIRGAVWQRDGEEGAGYSFAVRLTEGAARLGSAREPLRSFRGDVDVAPGMVRLEGRGELGGMPVSAAGSIALAPDTPPRFSLALRVDRITPRSLQAALAAGSRADLDQLRVPDGARLEVAVAGSQAAWRAEGVVAVARLGYGEVVAVGTRLPFGASGGEGVPLRAAGAFSAARLRWHDVAVDNPRLVLRVAGDDASAEGGGFVSGTYVSLQAEVGTAAGAAHVRAVAALHNGELSALPLPERLRAQHLRGRVSVRAVAEGPLQEPARWNGQAYLLGENLHLRAYRAERVEMRMRRASGGWELEAGTAEDPAYRLSARGTLTDDGAVDVRAQGRLLDLPALVRMSALEIQPRSDASDEEVTPDKAPAGDESRPMSDAVPLIGGDVLFSLAASGDLNGAIRAEGEATPDVTVNVSFQAYQPRYEEWQADYLGGTLHTVWHGESPRTWSLSDAKLVRLPATLTSRQILLTQVPDAPARGSDGFADAAAGKRGTGQEGDGVAGRRRTLRASLKGWEISGDVDAEGLTVQALARLAGVGDGDAVPAGDLSLLHLSLSGPLVGPRVSLAAESPALALAGFDLGRATLQASADLGRGAAEIRELGARLGSSRLAVTGSVRWDPDGSQPLADSVVISAQASGGGLRLRPLLRRFAPGVLEHADARGILELRRLELSGPLRALQGTARLAIEELVVNERAIRLEPLEIAWNPEAVVLTGVRARIGSGRLEAPYVAGLVGDGWNSGEPLASLAGEFRLREVPLPVLRQLIEDSPYFRGEETGGVAGLLRRWRDPLGGYVSAEAVLSLPGPQPAAWDPAVVAARLRAAAPGRTVAATIQAARLGAATPGGPDVEAEAALAWTPELLEVKRLRVTAGEEVLVSGSGRQSLAREVPATLDYSLQTEGVGLSSLARLPFSGLADALDPVQPLAGLLRGSILLRGTAERPEIGLDVTIERPVVAGLPVDELELRGATYSAASELLRAASIRLRKSLGPDLPEATLTAAGELPLTWPDLSVPRERPRALVVELPRQSVRVFSQLADDIEVLAAEQPTRESPALGIAPTLRELALTRGEMEGRIQLGGTAATPRNEGHFLVEHAVLRLDGLETAVTDFNARVELEGDVLRVARFEGVSTRGGGIQGGGEVRLGLAPDGTPGARLDLTLAIDGFRFEERKVGQLAAAFEGTRARGAVQTVDPADPTRKTPLRITGEWPRATIRGGVQFQDAVLFLAFQSLGQEGELPLPGNVGLDITLLTGRFLEVRNPSARLRLTGALRVENTLRAPVVRGDLRATAGTISLHAFRLRNIEGTVRVAIDRRGEELGLPTAPPITVSLTGGTSLRLARGPGGDLEDYEVTVEIRGAPAGGGVAGEISPDAASGLQLGGGGLRISVRTDPPLPGGEIEALIRRQLGVEGFDSPGANVVETLGQQFEMVLARGVSTAVTGRLEESIQDRLGLDIFSIDFGVAQPLRVRVGERLFGKVYGVVSQEFGGGNRPDERRFELHFRISPSLRIGVRHEEPAGRQVIFFQGSRVF